MLVGKNHAGGEGSCWWERIMWLLQDGKLLQKSAFCTKNIAAQSGLPSVRSQHKSQQTICQLAPDLLTNVPRSKIQVDVEIIGTVSYTHLTLPTSDLV